MRIALFGGSFNPPHVGHLLAASYVRAVAGIDALWLMPAHRHPFAKTLAPWDDRLALCRALAAHFTNVEVTEVEKDVPGDGRTIDTVEYLKAHHPHEDFTFIIGSDNLDQLSEWKDIERLKKEIPFLVLRRPGFEDQPGWTFSGITLPDFSSTQIRENISKNQPITNLTPEPVQDYILENSLYRE